MWRDQKMTIRDIAIFLEITPQAVQYRAKSRGLPSRRGYPEAARTAQRKLPEKEFTHMWLAGVPSKDIIAHFGVSHRTPAKTARRLGLPPRGRGWHAKTTLRDYLQAKITLLMAREAKITRAAMRDAEMIDKLNPNWRGAA
jgi:hypothetical protein